MALAALSDRAAQAQAVSAYLRASRFAEAGGVITDLDGTAVFERDGRVAVTPEVELGLKRLAEQGRPVAINSLRFPLNVVRTFGRAWSAVTDEILPIISLNGAQTGHIVHGRGSSVVFEEIDAVPLASDELVAVVEEARTLVADGLDDLVVFFYPRDWTAGELIWTPDPAREQATRARYASASEVFSGPVERLAERLFERDICMVFRVIAIPEDRRMAYQHAKPSAFVTHAGVDKLSGARRLADRLGFDLAASVGAGDTPMDIFLAGCGLAVHVGPTALPHHGLSATVRVADAHALGGVLALLAERPEGA